MVDDYYQYNELIYYDNKNLVNEFGQDFANILVIAWDVIYEEMRRYNMFKKYNIEEMKIEEMGLLGGLITINNAIKDTENKIINGGIKGISKEDYICILEDMQRYKDEFGGDTKLGWTNGENDEDFVGYVFVRENKIIDVVEYQ